MSEYICKLTEKMQSDMRRFVREPIVRCCDCTNFAHDQLGDYCTLLDFEDVKSMGNMFCAWGERREK